MKTYSKKHSSLFWIIFWSLSILLLIGFYFFLNSAKKSNEQSVSTKSTTETLVSETIEQEITGKMPIGTLISYFTQKDGQSRTFLLLFQNNLEIRPSGGYIGTFGIISIKDGDILKLETHDLANFDGRIADDEIPPYPMGELLNISSWKMRDSNWSPNFATSAQEAMRFYYKGDGSEKFDGVIGITANVLTELLAITGPISIPGYPGEYTSQGGIMALEYQVEQGFVNQGIATGDRKSIMPLLGDAIIDKINFKNPITLVRLGTLGLRLFESKDIQLYFTDRNLQKDVIAAGWSGNLDTTWSKDYLMMVDANLGALKSDAAIVRSAKYTIDLAKEKPEIDLAITYQHTATKHDFMTSDYRTYLRVYIPQEAWIKSITGNSDTPQFENSFGKKSVGTIINVPLGSTRTVHITYTLPETYKENYDLKIQKQAGTIHEPMEISIIRPNEEKETSTFDLIKDTILSEQ